MRAAGIGIWSLVRAISVIGILALAISLLNSLYLAPMATAKLLQEEDSLKSQQASFEVQPRVFYEDFKNYVLYVQDVRASAGAAQWRQVFLAESGNPILPKVTTAQEATVVSQDNQTLLMRLRNGTEHELVTSSDKEQYQVSTFSESELFLETGPQVHPRIGHEDIPLLAMSNHALYSQAQAPDGRLYLIEFHKRFTYPVACIVLMLIGVPLGMSSRQGGKGAGFVLSIALVFVYYLISDIGLALARQGKIPVLVGMWSANILFVLCSIILMWQMALGGPLAGLLSSFTVRVKRATSKLHASGISKAEPRSRRRFPLILDEYIVTDFLKTLALVLVSFVMLLLLFTFFERLGDIIRNRAPLVTVGRYLINLIPNMIYLVTPLGVLVAALVTLGNLTRTNELTAMKAVGISLYRIVLPILAIAAILATILAWFGDSYLPNANRRQEALLNEIKRKPARTFLHPGQNWIMGLQRPGKADRIFYYQFFDSRRDQFANISVFEMDQDDFSILSEVFAGSAHWEPRINQWVFEQGWERRFDAETQNSYRVFTVQSFPDITEQPQYFKREALESQEMSFGELHGYIHDLQQSGFDTRRLAVQLNRKLADPVITLVMAVLAIPFAVSMGRRGALTVIAGAIGLAIAYWVLQLFFEALGNVGMLPSLLAAWSPDLLFGLAGSYLLLKTPT
jgi:LPS export ABC transporter permease LptG